ncbi:MAG TPA: nucleotidyltransferase domain-containing protein [Rickettsia endosymbiont of Ceroptres masudai]|nr:nucleotidyltransferase domain-containing protein [Rickettsia endosymbiont of Ceroptres masudai]
MVQQILDIAQDKITMIILYGSFARGDWVRDLPNGYHSDTDILIILKKGKYKGYTALRLEENIYKRLEKTGVINPKQIIPYDSLISIILESIDEVNRQLEIFLLISKKKVFFYMIAGNLCLVKLKIYLGAR